ncbi:MAG: Capsular polysaccharide biosynthesis protein [Pseudomonas orientalis]|nr:Capsular polysaccharide biosynthesis protein [Pseudomonas orientalis]
MPKLKKITLRHCKIPSGQWTEVAPGIKLIEKAAKTTREFETQLSTFSENPDYENLLAARAGGQPNKYISPSVYICEIEDGFISPKLSKLPRYWMFGNNTHYIDDNLYSKWQEHLPEGMVASTSEDGSICDVSFPRAININQPVLFLNFFNNTNHLLHESLPALLYIKDIANRNPDYLVYSSPLKPYIKRFLYDLGFPVERIIEGFDCAITSPKIILTCFAAGGHLNTPSPALDETCQMLLDRLPKVYRPGQTPDRIFVSRSDASQRILINEREVTDYLIENHGFTVVIPGHMSVAQQIEYFSNADIVVGPHGMGINNFAFAKKPSLLMEIFQPNWVREAYLRQAQLKNSSYAAYIGTLVDGNLLVDMSKFRTFFERQISELV